MTRDRPEADRFDEPTVLVQARLFDQRILVVSGRLSNERASHLVAQLLSLDALGDEPISLALSSSSGELDAALALVDVVDALGVPLHVTAVGLVEGPAVAVLAVAHRRVAGAHARLRLCEEEVTYDGHARGLESFLAQHRSRLEAFAICLARRSSRPVEAFLEDIEHRRVLSPEEALRDGLIDAIEHKGAPITRLGATMARPSLGFRFPSEGPRR